MPLPIGELSPKMLRNRRPSSNPHILLSLNILNELLQSWEPPRFPNLPTMQTNCHHFRAPITPFLIQRIKRILEVVQEITGATKSRGYGEFPVIAVVAILIVRYVGKKGRLSSLTSKESSTSPLDPPSLSQQAHQPNTAHHRNNYRSPTQAVPPTPDRHPKPTPCSSD